MMTDAKGRFALATDGAGPFRLSASTNDRGSCGTVAAVSPGDHEVVVRVPLQDGFRLRVVDERDQPVEDYRVTCFEVDARRINVAIHDSVVTLTGNVHSWAERFEARQAAWAAPGVRTVEDRITVVP